MSTTIDRSLLDQAVATIRKRWPKAKPRVGLVLGSGWSDVVAQFKARDTMDYSDIPGLGKTGVVGHAGRLVWGTAHGVETFIFQGRRHWYEGIGWTAPALPIFVLKSLGVKIAMLTNAAGGIRSDLKPGSLMVINDHINFMASTPLIGSHDPFWGPRFPDQSEVYDGKLRKALHRAGEASGVKLASGVYLADSGPTYETPAEIRAFRTLGADAVGMSTVPEATLAKAAGLRVVGLSCITNLAAGISPTPLSHEEVTEATKEAMPRMKNVILNFWKELAKES